MKRIFENAKGSLLTTAAGACVGLPDIIDGITKKDWQLLIRGLIIIIWGAATNEHSNLIIKK